MLPSVSFTPAVPSAPSTTENLTEDLPWPERDVAMVMFRLRAANAKEPAARAFLAHLAGMGVRRLRPYVDNISDDDLDAYLDHAEEAARVAAAPSGRRGDIQFVRTPPRWPWRTSTGRAGGGSHA